MKVILNAVAVIAMAGAVVGPRASLAQFDGPGSGVHAVKPLPPVDELRWEGDSVKSVEEFAEDYEKQNRPVVLRGRIVEQLSPDRYMFEDTSGRIRIDADPHLFPSPPINENTTVDIVGNVDQQHMKGVEIDVAQIRVVSR